MDGGVSSENGRRILTRDRDGDLLHVIRALIVTHDHIKMQLLILPFPKPYDFVAGFIQIEGIFARLRVDFEFSPSVCGNGWLHINGLAVLKILIVFFCNQPKGMAISLAVRIRAILVRILELNSAGNLVLTFQDGLIEGVFLTIRDRRLVVAGVDGKFLLN